MITKCDQCGESATVTEIKTNLKRTGQMGTVKDDEQSAGITYVIDCPKCGSRTQPAAQDSD